MLASALGICSYLWLSVTILVTAHQNKIWHMQSVLIAQDYLRQYDKTFILRVRAAEVSTAFVRTQPCNWALCRYSIHINRKYTFLCGKYAEIIKARDAISAALVCSFLFLYFGGLCWGKAASYN